MSPRDIDALHLLASGDPIALDAECGFNNDELLHLGIGYGIPGPLSVDQIRREAVKILEDMSADRDAAAKGALRAIGRALHNLSIDERDRVLIKALDRYVEAPRRHRSL